jgi:hypothetical protein
MKLEEKNVSPATNKADALLFFVDENGNATNGARSLFPDICQVAEMMFMTKTFPSGGIAFTTAEGRHIVVGQRGPIKQILDYLIQILDERKIESINVASIDEFNYSIAQTEISNTEDGPTIIFCNPLE